jgi:hypothetical protein
VISNLIKLKDKKYWFEIKDYTGKENYYVLFWRRTTRAQPPGAFSTSSRHLAASRAFSSLLTFSKLL